MRDLNRLGPKGMPITVRRTNRFCDEDLEFAYSLFIFGTIGSGVPAGVHSYAKMTHNKVCNFSLDVCEFVYPA